MKKKQAKAVMMLSEIMLTKTPDLNRLMELVAIAEKCIK